MFKFLKLFCSCEYYEEDMTTILETNEVKCKCRKCGKEGIIYKDKVDGKYKMKSLN